MHNAPFKLSARQKKQVSLLYYFASLDYLKGLQKKLHALIASIDPTLDLAKLQNRDALLTDKRWGIRNTSENWANNGWPFLADFELSVAKDIAKRAFDAYSVTGVSQCERGLAELSLDWMTPDEQDDFEARLEQISLYAMNIDKTMDRHSTSGRWNDYSLTRCLNEFPDALTASPALRLRADIKAETGMVPARTGVYLPLDDSYGTPQFCWTGQPAGELLECSTFNDLGLEILTAVGPDDLWINDKSMYAFVQNHLKDPRLTSDSFFTRSVTKPHLTPSLVARHAFTSRPCSWIFVEQIHGELENWAESTSKETPPGGPRISAGAACAQPGYYFTPAKLDSRRRFETGEIMPSVGGDYGVTIWQWDVNQ